MKITDLELEDDAIKMQVAELLFGGFADISPASWPSLRVAREEVEESLGPHRISLVALDGRRVLGWVSATRQYNGYTWELHPLVVRARHRSTGVGRALVAELEVRVRDTGAITLWVASDDENGQTSIAGQDLYPDPLKSLSLIRNLKRHPFEFYQKLGFTLCGVLPDANGLGKPDIFLSKRVRPIN